MKKNKFGRTEHELPILGFGAQRIVDEHNCTEEEAIQIVNRAIDEGITYFDTAPSYSDGQSEERVGKALAGTNRRNEVWLATKTHERTYDGAWRLLEESLKRLQTDRVQEWRMHNIIGFDELDLIFDKDGAMKAAQEAKEQGVIEYISISGHTNPQVQLEGIRRFPFDSALVPTSIVDHHFHSFVHEFIPTANEKGTAIIGMKVMALGKLAPWYEQALRYSFGLPITCSILGMESMEQFEKNIAIAKSFTPLTESEQLEVMKETIHLARPDVLRWKAADWDPADKWYER
ncbi:aldo/keto reductase [Aneurinibacillus tyrosinisolvens]|uniref:aldo/keto reductase n=1 Tax=Aneurinibacillus tyrosinisolvens TaxID=1443435 RepID=UPI00063F4557|nr:aldo/keto reductase [Aneurinibacillus tyrosinisolvens]